MTPYEEYDKQLKAQEREQKNRVAVERREYKKKQKERRSQEIKDSAQVYKAMQRDRKPRKEMIDEQRKFIYSRKKIKSAIYEEKLRERKKFENVSIIDLLTHAK